MESLKAYVFDVYGLGRSVKSILIMSNSDKTAREELFKKHNQATTIRLVNAFYIDELIIEGEDKCVK